MRSFEGLADYLIPRRKKVHLLVLVVSVLMIPGIIASFEPIDIESYDMESPELEANQVLRDEFTAALRIIPNGSSCASATAPATTTTSSAAAAATTPSS